MGGKKKHQVTLTSQLKKKSQLTLENIKLMEYKRIKTYNDSCVVTPLKVRNNTNYTADKKNEQINKTNQAQIHFQRVLSLNTPVIQSQPEQKVTA